MIGQQIQLIRQGCAPGTPMCNGGGSSGGSQKNYANLEKLYGVQSQAAQFMLDNSMPYLPGTMRNTDRMVDDAMSGQLGLRARNQASYDANESIASSNRDAMRQLSGMGALGDPSGGRFMDAMNRNAIGSAQTRTGAMNQASNWAEDQKWNRNAGQFAQLTGVGDGAIQGLSSAASGFGQMANAQNQNAQANAAGYGQFGAAVGSALFKADGGYIDTKSVRLANGGDPWAAYKKQNPIASSKLRGENGSPLGAVMAGAAPHMLSYGLKELGVTDAMKSGASTLKNAIGLGAPGADAATKAATDSVSKLALDTAGTASGEALVGEAATRAATEGMAQAAVNSAAGAGAAGAAGAGAGAAGAGAAGAAGAGALGAVGTALPWVGLAYGVGSLLDLWSEGGDVDKPGGVPRKDFTPGGDVKGPGTETSDSIPAWLSRGEVVNNAESVKLPADETKRVIDQWEMEGGSTKDLLLKINDKGLERRYAVGGLPAKDGAVALAGGGFLGGNLGIALGAGAQEWNRQRQMKIAEDQAAQQKEMFEMQKADRKRAQDRQSKVDDATKHLSETIGAAENFRSGMSGIGGIGGLKSAVEQSGGRLTPEAEKAYIDAMVDTRADNAGRNAVSKLREIDPLGAMKASDALTRQARDSMLEDASRRIAAGDYEGFANFMNDNAPSGDGTSYRFVGQVADGIRLARVGKDGRPVSVQDFGDNSELLGFIGAALDPSKVSDYLKMQSDAKRLEAQAARDERKYREQEARDERRFSQQMELLDRRLAGGSGGSNGGGSSSGAQGGGQSSTGERFKPNERTTAIKEAFGEDPAMISEGMRHISLLSSFNPSVNEHEMIPVAQDLARLSRGEKPSGAVSMRVENDGRFSPVISYKTPGGSSSYVIGKPIAPAALDELSKQGGAYNGLAAPSPETMKLAQRRFAESSLNELRSIAEMLRGNVPGVDPVQFKQKLLERGEIDGMPSWKFIENIPGRLSQLEQAVSDYSLSDAEANRNLSRAPSAGAADKAAAEWAARKGGKAPPATSGDKKPSAFTDEEIAAAKRAGGYEPRSNFSISDAAKSAGSAVSSALSGLTGTLDANFAKNVVGQLDSGRLQQGDAIALMQKFRANPEIRKLFSDDQLWAIQVVAGRRL